MGGRYKGFIVCSWEVGKDESKAKLLYEKYKALEGEEWFWIVSEPWIIDGVEIGYETNIVFKDQKRGPLNLTTVNDDSRLFEEIGDRQQARVRLVSLSTETNEPHLIEETGEWLEGGAVDIEFEVCEEGTSPLNELRDSE